MCGIIRAISPRLVLAVGSPLVVLVSHAHGVWIVCTSRYVEIKTRHMCVETKEASFEGPPGRFGGERRSYTYQVSPG